MATIPQLNTPALGKRAYITPCACGNSMLALALPQAHCPACHHTWRAKGLSAPNRCPRCQFNMYQWRVRKGIPVIEVGEAI